MNHSTTNTTVNTVSKLLIVIAIIGAVNWGLIGFFNFNLVDAVFGGGSAEETSGVSRIIYAIVGLAGLIAATMLPKLHAVAGRPSYADRSV